jgi:hypothetical protein
MGQLDAFSSELSQLVVELAGGNCLAESVEHRDRLPTGLVIAEPATRRDAPAELLNTEAVRVLVEWDRRGVRLYRQLRSQPLRGAAGQELAQRLAYRHDQRIDLGLWDAGTLGQVCDELFITHGPSLARLHLTLPVRVGHGPAG